MSHFLLSCSTIKNNYCVYIYKLFTSISCNKTKANLLSSRPQYLESINGYFTRMACHVLSLFPTHVVTEWVLSVQPLVLVISFRFFFTSAPSCSLPELRVKILKPPYLSIIPEEYNIMHSNIFLPISARLHLESIGAGHEGITTCYEYKLRVSRLFQIRYAKTLRMRRYINK